MQAPDSLSQQEAEVFGVVARELERTGVAVAAEFLSALVLTAEALAAMRVIFRDTKRGGDWKAGAAHLKFHRGTTLMIIGESLQFPPKVIARLIGGVQ
jgi:hypothetical protein